MKRCLDLAMQGCGSVAPNPMVGAVLVYSNKIIGEGYHQQYGGPHAEVNCINSVLAENKKFIPNSTLYVSLEPCNHHGKTPPCSDLIIQHKIPELVIGCKDPFELVNGTGIEKLKKAGVNIHPFLLEKEAVELNKRFFHFHQKKRPYIILKWAQTDDGFIALPKGIPLKISNEITDQLVHRWRSEEAAIIVGTNTAINDNPSLTNRLWGGANPIRIIIDKNLKVPTDHKIYDQSSVTYIFNEIEEKNLSLIHI
jgi:diaminohydroxyphosphoribosylaminopyrimidine deaminase/5-amino-6-(5-phosphoribosylamino)uracil reductase